MTSFQSIRARAEQRKGGADKLKALISPKCDPAALAALSDDRVLAEMAKRIFTSHHAGTRGTLTVSLVTRRERSWLRVLLRRAPQ